MSYAKLSDLVTTHPQVADAVQAARDWKKLKAEGVENISLVLSGPNGAGKTHIARAILWSIRAEVGDLAEGYQGLVENDAVIGHEIHLGRFHKAANLLVKLGPYTDDDGRMREPNPGYFVGDSQIIVLDDFGANVSLPYIKGEAQIDEIQTRWFLFFDYCMGRKKVVAEPVHYTVSDDGVAMSGWKHDRIPYPPSLIITTNLDIGGGDKSELAKYVGMRVWSRLQEFCPAGFMVNMRDVPDWRKKRSGR